MNGSATEPNTHTPKAPGRLLRRQPMPLSSLPSHPLLAPHQTASKNATKSPQPTLAAFITEALNSAHAFMTALPAQFERKGSRPSSPATSLVELLTTDITHPVSYSASTNGTSTNSASSAAGAKPETWFARRSIHADAATPGTAAWPEFKAGLFERHSEKEVLYTPDVFDAVQIACWDEMIGDEVRAAVGEAGWAEVHMEVYEMAHRIPAPFGNRVFAVVVVGGVAVATSGEAGEGGGGGGEGAGGGGKTEFITAQMPVEIGMLKESMYSNGRHRKEGSTAQKQAKAVLGEYVSVERAAKQDDGNIIWEMATCSDAKGWLPASVQKMGIPGAIIKDVGFFMQWIDTQRKG